MNEAYKKLLSNPTMTMKEIQASFHKLAIKNHPDRGGSEEIMKELVAAWVEVRKNHSEVDAKGNNEAQKASYDLREDIINLAVETLNFWGHECPVQIVICGQWIWVDGDRSFFTDDFRSFLKEKKYFWMRNKKSWAFRGCRSFSRGKYSMNDIYNRYGRYDVKKRASTGHQLSA